MAKNFGKIILGAVAISAAVGGVYYYLTRKDQCPVSDYDDEDFDAFDVEFDDDDTNRNYTTLDDIPAKNTPSEEESNSAMQEAQELLRKANATLEEANATLNAEKKTSEVFFE